MNCPFCKSSQSSVIDKRAVKSSGEIRRRRECLSCHRRFTTYERVCVIELFVIKRGGQRQIYDRSKLKGGIERALEKRPALLELEEIVSRIERKLFKKGENEIETKTIGKAVLLELKKVDQVAYLRFASVYRHFENPDDFTKELANLSTLLK